MLANDDANAERQSVFLGLPEEAQRNPYVSIFITKSLKRILSDKPALFPSTFVSKGDTNMGDKRVPLCPVAGIAGGTDGNLGKKGFDGDDWVRQVQH